MGFFANALGALGKVGNVIDLPASSVRDVLAWENPFDQWATPTQSKNRMYGRDVLTRWGLLGENTPGLDLGDIAGGAFDLATDPFNLGAAAWAGKTARAGARARAANTGIQQANDLSELMRAKGALPEETIPYAKKVYRANLLNDSEPLARVPNVRKSTPLNLNETSITNTGEGDFDGGVEYMEDLWGDLVPGIPEYDNLRALAPTQIENIQKYADNIQSFYSVDFPPSLTLDELISGADDALPDWLKAYSSSPSRQGMDLTNHEALFLPYVAPAYQDLMNVPKVPKGRLAALLGTHNALARKNQP